MQSERADSVWRPASKPFLNELFEPSTALARIDSTGDGTASASRSGPSSSPTDTLHPTDTLLTTPSNDAQPWSPDLQSPSLHRTLPYEPGVFNFTLGSRFLEDPGWGQLDNQFALGLDYTIKQRNAWIGLNFGLVGSGTRQTVAGVDTDSWMAEAYLGPRLFLTIPRAPIYGYVGVAASLAYGELERIDSRASETVFGASASAGLIYELNSAQALGLEWRTLQFTDFNDEANGGPKDMNYNQIALVFSAAF